MKTFALSLLIILSIPNCKGQYQAAMESAVIALRENKSAGQLQAAVNKLDRIAASEPKQWLPLYWCGYGYILMANNEKDNGKKDLLLDRADDFLKRLDGLESRNDEIEVLKVYYVQARMSIDPMGRYATYGPLMNLSLRKAKEINPKNPRALLLEGSVVYNTPEAFGGGKQKGCALLNESLEAFKEFTPITTIHPDWGREQVEALLKTCN